MESRGHSSGTPPAAAWLPSPPPAAVHRATVHGAEEPPRYTAPLSWARKGVMASVVGQGGQYEKDQIVEELMIDDVQGTHFLVASTQVGE